MKLRLLVHCLDVFGKKITVDYNVTKDGIFSIETKEKTQNSSKIHFE